MSTDVWTAFLKSKVPEINYNYGTELPCGRLTNDVAIFADCWL